MPCLARDDVALIRQFLVVLEVMQKKAEGVVKGGKYLKKAIVELGLAEGSSGTNT